MTLKNVRRCTFSLPKTVIQNLEDQVPKSKRSKFIAEIITKNLKNKQKEIISLEEVEQFWKTMAKSVPDKTDKTGLELLREDRASH